MQSEKVFNQDLYFKKTVKFVGEPMTHLESIASSAVLAHYSGYCIFLFSIVLVAIIFIIVVVLLWVSCAIGLFCF